MSVDSLSGCVVRLGVSVKGVASVEDGEDEGDKVLCNFFCYFNYFVSYGGGRG